MPDVSSEPGPESSPGARSADAIVEVVELASRDSIREILKHVAESLGAVECVLWQEVPYRNVKRNINETRLYVIASWTNTDRDYIYIYNHSGINSPTGEAIDRMELRVVSRDDPGLQSGCSQAFHRNRDLKTMCIAPLKFSGSKRGAINIFRASDSPFDAADRAQAQRFAKVVPICYESIRERTSVATAARIRELVQDGELISRKVSDVVDAFCAALRGQFSCIEASVFLEDPANTPGEFLFQGTRPDFLQRDRYKVGDRGLTPWVLFQRKPLKIPDLKQFEDDQPSLNYDFPGINWGGINDIEEATRRTLNRAPGDPLPPVSFIAVPVIVGNELLGAVRCCTMTRAPYYFSDEDIALLALAASQIGHFWQRFVKHEEMLAELHAWQGFVENISSLNLVALGEMSGDKPAEREKIWKAGLRVAKKFPGATLVNTRVFNVSTKRLEYDLVDGADIATADFTRRKQFSSLLRQSRTETAGDWAYRHDQLLVFPGEHRAPFRRSEFESASKLIIAPIGTRTERYGVLEVSGDGNRRFPAQTESMTLLLSRQLGIYQYVSHLISEVRSTEGQLADTSRVQDRVYQILEHQLRRPIRMSLQRAALLLLVEPGDAGFARRVHAIRGLLGKAFDVVNSLEMFRLLEGRRPLKIALAPISSEDLRKSLIQTCADNELINEHGVRATLVRESVALPSDLILEADFDLLEQAVHNVADNAFKYSLPQTEITISAQLSGQYLGISVANYGLPITGEDCGKVARRGWRGSLAKALDIGGSGIGLWLVDHIMKAHGGLLDVIPTDDNKLTRIILWFPVKKRGS